jgi:hypothetical protein
MFDFRMLKTIHRLGAFSIIVPVKYNQFEARGRGARRLLNEER